MPLKNTTARDIKALDISVWLLSLSLLLIVLRLPTIKNEAAKDAAYQIEELLLNQQGTSHEKETVKAINHILRWPYVELGENNK